MKYFATLLIIILLYSCNSKNKSLEDFTIAEFMQIYSSGGLREGSNGYKIFKTWSKKTKGLQQVFHWQKSPKNHEQLSFFEGGVDFSSLSPDGKYLVAGVSKGGSEQSKLLIYNTTTKKWMKVPTPKKAKCGGVNWHRSSQYFFYYSNEDSLRDFHIFSYNVIKNKKEKILGLKGYNYLSDSNLTGDKLIIATRISNTEVRPFLYDIKSKKLKPILWNKDKKYIFAGLFFSKDENNIYLLTNVFSQFISFAKYNIENKKLTPILAGLTKKWGIADIEHDPNREFFTLTLNEQAYNKIYISSEKSGFKAKEFSPLGPGMYRISQITNETIYFVFQSSKITQEAYSMPRDFENGKATQLTFSDTQGIPLDQFHLPKLISYSSFDGLRIPAFLYLPANYKKGSTIPFIIHAHGGPESQIRPWFIRHFQYLLSRGYGVLAPNVRGSRGYGKKYLAMDNYTKRKDSVKDYYYGVKWLIDNGYTEKGKIGVKGGSYGGYIVMALITDYPDLFSAAINRVGIVNFVTFLKNTKAYRRAIREKEYGPLSDSKFLKSISPIHKIDQIKTPLLVVHGVNDPRVPIGEARQIIKSLKEKKAIVDSIIFEDEGHGISKLNNRLLYYRKMAAWFDKYLKNKKP